MAKKLIAIVSFLLLGMTAWGKDGDTFVVNGMYFMVISETDKTCQVGWWKGSNSHKAVADATSGKVIVPTHANGYKVTRIDDMAFRVLKNVTSVSIPYTVEDIGDNAFYNSPNLKTIELNCKKLKKPYLPFYGNNNIKTIILGDSVEEVGFDLFYKCQGLSSVTMGKNVKRIGARAFSGCTSLTNIDLPSSLEEINSQAFENCSKLARIEILENVTYITTNAFWGCKSLTAVSFANGTETLHIGTTTDASSQNVIMFGDSPLETVYLGRNIYLGNAKYSPFRNNSSLESVRIGTTVKELPDAAFYGCKNLKDISFGHERKDTYLFSRKKAANIVDVEIATAIKSISSSAFEGCTSLKSIFIPSSVTTINDKAFYGCIALDDITIPSKIYSIGNQSFSKTAIKTITIPQSVNKIGNRVFAECSSLKTIEMQHTYANKGTMGDEVFASCELLDSIILPSSWSIGTGLFKGCINLRIAELPSIITTIPASTFEGCHNLQDRDIYIRQGVNEIGTKAYYGCEKLEHMNLLTVEKIGSSAFEGCKGLKSIKLSKYLLDIPSRLFWGCSSLESIELPDSLNSIGAYAFQDCTSLTNLTIPNTVNSIGNNILEGCTGLKELVSFSNSYFNIPNITTLVALVAPSVISRYKASNIRPVVTLETHEASVKIESTDDYLISSANLIAGLPTSAEKGTVVLTGLSPNKQHKIHIEGTAFTRQIKGNIDVTTRPITIDITIIKATNLTLQVRGMYNSGDAEVIATDFGDYGTGSDVTITGLSPGRGARVTFNVTTSDGSVSSITKWLETTPVKATVKSEPSSTSCILNGSYSIIDATRISSGFDEDIYESDVLTICGLEPNTTYKNKYRYTVYIKEGNPVSETVSFTTKALEIKTLTPKVTNKGEAIVCATTNIADEETNVGFEWRKVDAPDVVPSKTGAAAIYDGTMEGMIKNLDASTYWKVRPYYESAAGNKYYGEWVGFDPSDFSYFEPTVHTYANAVVTEGAAVLTGYVMAGSDAIEEQGFEYWLSNMGNSRSNRAPSSGIQRVTGTGQRMVVQLSDLQAGTTYTYRAFVKTNRGTTYGEEMTFTTKESITDVVETVTSDKTNLKIIGYYNLQGRKLSKPEKGKLNIIRYSDGTTKKVITAP